MLTRPVKAFQVVVFCAMGLTSTQATSASVTSLTSAEAQVQTEFRVEVQVTADNLIRSQIASNINRALRTIPDIVVVDGNPHYRFQILASEVYTRQGNPVGVVLSAVAIRPVDVELLKPLLREEFTQLMPLVSAAIGGDQIHLGHWVVVGAENEIGILCEKIVAGFDSTTLESLRKLAEKLKR